MGIQGDLQEMHLPNLVQLIVQSGGAARILIRHEQEVGAFYINDRQLQHAEVIRSEDDRLSGDEAVYYLLQWETGTFKVERSITTPHRSLTHSWDFLLMEGLRRLDERNRLDGSEEEQHEESIEALLEHLEPEDAQALQDLLALQENKEMASKSEQLKQILADLVNNSTDIIGAAIVDNDGLLLASQFSSNIDGNRVAAVSAGLISLSARSAQQLNQGAVKQTLIQADNGNIIALRATDTSFFVALMPVGVNLGMAFMECRDAANSIRATM
jgi:predicted regulator of Ras-like GTPase activity (Roadblock/LC7/MglB family)